jgi:hypothetical protein
MMDNYNMITNTFIFNETNPLNEDDYGENEGGLDLSGELRDRVDYNFKRNEIYFDYGE